MKLVENKNIDIFGALETQICPFRQFSSYNFFNEKWTSIYNSSASSSLRKECKS